MVDEGVFLMDDEENQSQKELLLDDSNLKEDDERGEDASLYQKITSWPQTVRKWDWLVPSSLEIEDNGYVPLFASINGGCGVRPMLWPEKTTVAVTHCKHGRALIKINGCLIELVEPETLRYKAYEPILMRISVHGGGHTSQIYAICQSIMKALVGYYQKYVDEQSKKGIKGSLVWYDRTLLVADPRRCKPKKFGGCSVRARFQKTYRPKEDVLLLPPEESFDRSRSER